MEDNERIEVKAEEFPFPWAEMESQGEGIEFSSLLWPAIVITIWNRISEEKDCASEKVLFPQAGMYKILSYDLKKKKKS